MGSKFWLNDEDKTMVERAVGNGAAQYLAWSASNDMLSEFPPSGEDLGVQQSLRKIVEASDWTYAIYWHVSNSKSGRSALIWGDGHCRESKEDKGEEKDSNGCKIEKSGDGDDRRWALRKIRASFGRSEDANKLAAEVDEVSDVEMLYLTSRYLAFPFDRPSIPCLSFNSGRSVWVSDEISCLECYEWRSYLAKLARLETVVFVPTRLGVVEIGSRRSIPEDMSVIYSAKFIAGTLSFSQAMSAPTSFGNDPNVWSSRSGPISSGFSPKVGDYSVYSSGSYDFQTLDGAQIYGEVLSKSTISNMDRAREGSFLVTDEQNPIKEGMEPVDGTKEASNRVEAEREGREKLDQNVVEHNKGTKNLWRVKEDLVLMKLWCLASEGRKRDKKSFSWARVHKLFHEARVENPEEIGDRNMDSMKGRWKRLSENGKKWISAYEKAYGRKTSEMSEKDVEKEALAVYGEGGGKFQDLFVFNEVMSKHPKWAIKLGHKATRIGPQNDEGGDESRGNSKRSRISEDGEYPILSKLDTPSPSSGCSTIPRPTTTNGDQSYPTNEVAVEIRALRLARDNEVEVMRKLESARMELELKKEERKMMKMNHIMLNTLLARDHLSTEEEEMKRHLMAIVLKQ